ncbi:DUF2628 domain-containing protein [Pectobacterium parmentieri]|uniref:DUF2628 domain-containing protein n=1 Tax=Pectobacterium parmentieri TaxID=1905730 RepID=A0A0H3I677_PECPM|nr:DUF2628 domain-containing protein [Pectobacterium parmentieri]ACX89150.1 conserved hypothetical protein [Pectobacterium parmentieri WPP163]AFI91485.1 Hypothetical protein W5S_3414 [Pectobacterium parmentieri]AOR57606.1 hypothetical protein A8F97_01595 [Pectobacterium parmentieri]AYH02547.1 DUF2628 domain-containing protein [Pectobacterium parmentieri]AYH06812.1 DUF2628 domain-containing protein [Pectobacterium parmentieri]
MENTVEKQYSKKWQTRISFYNEFGAPNTPAHKNALKNLSFFEKIRINFNFIAFFFGLIYFFVLGLWRKNLTLFAITIAIGIIVNFIQIIFDVTIPENMDTPIGLALSVMWGSTANYAYYLKETRNSKSWNPFEGMF